ncbi:hypothetical protein IFM89_014070 [Coptis chinensis]|uniref:Uncharacterized protein n=1 Tax=Coptis chinensis TaxID=261450 RepID=A0A835HPX1_9MAGN|nr:hypothetical protein IFM89_014070 [Coptis chinensis]
MTSQQLSSRIMASMKLYIQKNLSDVKDSYSLQALVTRLGLQINFKPQEVHWCKWKPAEQEAFMLNTDGSVQENGMDMEGLYVMAWGLLFELMQVARQRTQSYIRRFKPLQLGLSRPKS